MKSRIAGGQIFHGGQCNMTPTSLEHGVGCHSRADAVTDILLRMMH